MSYIWKTKCSFCLKLKDVEPGDLLQPRAWPGKRLESKSRDGSCTSGWSDCIWWGFTPGFLQQSRLLCLAALWHQGNLGTMGYWSWVMRINFGCWSNIARSCWLQAGSQSMHSHKNKLLDTKDSKSLFTASLRVIWPRATAGWCIISVWVMHYLHNWAELCLSRMLKEEHWELWEHMDGIQSIVTFCCLWFVLEFY